MAGMYRWISKVGPKVWTKVLAKRDRRLKNKLKNLVLKRRGLFWEGLENHCLNQVTPIDHPMILVAQVQRSGGTLLSQLFDGHPQVHPHPYEIRIGSPRKYDWPEIHLNESPNDWFATLFEAPIVEILRDGYKKGHFSDIHRFLFNPSLQRQIFLQSIAQIQNPNHREIFNAYMTSYFNAWLDNQNVLGEKRFISAFVARMNIQASNMDQFFEIYPDGYLISTVRNPVNWFASARRHDADTYGDLDKSIAIWKSSAEANIRNHKAFGDKVILIKFEDLIKNTETVVRHICARTGLDFDETMLTPTFNRMPIKANTSFKEDATTGIVSATLQRKAELSDEERQRIDDQTAALYSQAQEICTQFESPN